MLDDLKRVLRRQEYENLIDSMVPDAVCQTPARLLESRVKAYKARQAAAGTPATVGEIESFKKQMKSCPNFIQAERERIAATGNAEYLRDFEESVLLNTVGHDVEAVGNVREARASIYE